ncbi:translation elongation factor 4 [Amygdalobacter nucleatus]|uniref:Elongation factor 4 n=1 Tax=Amygdalobacter nucleatus TaxID=3029274 RepID=A0A133YCV3_9FIRM|nr:translation elongation factor 4 [Amygdalobacter nucleatus]KXB40980.1 GTP-binding protein LepA [Amygdalobacter nucleatus]MDF0485888.1 translation elongation factor 4 [Amygdalobacter nucleatus]
MTQKRLDLIRNFSIIAHIDHGKSTLADRLIQDTGVLTEREMQEQVLDNMDIERERGITIKAQASRMYYTAKSGETYVLNLIDTPGHVDFNYEVSRSLAACESAILVVDAAQGVEAQTLANCYLAADANLEILPVINKIDLPSAQPEVVRNEIEEAIGIDASYAPLISAKNNIGIDDLLEAIIKYLPAPTGDEDGPLQALVFDSKFDAYQGVIVHVRIKNGSLRKGDRIRFMHSQTEYDVTEVGYFKAGQQSDCKELLTGEVGYFTASIKDIHDSEVGDTVTLANHPAKEALPGYKPARQMVYCGIYPADSAKYEDLKDALSKLVLNDGGISFEPETSLALGFGFRCGFLGLLHYEISLERLEREFNLDLISTIPSVMYELIMTNGETLMLDNPTNMPDPSKISEMREPIVKADIMAPKDYVGNIMELCQERRGTFIDMTYVDQYRVNIEYHLPFNEIIYDFFDALKSRTRGYASLDYDFLDYEKDKLVKLDILINGDVVDALSFIVHEESAYTRARKMCEKLRDNIPRQMFEIPIQAAIGGKVIARETVRAYRKDVLAKCYGGDISRKKKLLEKQKEGKKKMRQIGSISIPQDAFMAVLKLDDE